MAGPLFFDRVKEQSVTTSTGSMTLAGAVTGYRTFASVLATNDTCYYVIAHQSANEWEVGFGTLTGATTFARTEVQASSNSGSLVSFSAGTKDVFIGSPAFVQRYVPAMTPILNSTFG